MANDYEAIVIGGGPGGYVAAIRLGRRASGRRAHVGEGARRTEIHAHRQPERQHGAQASAKAKA